MPDKSIITQSCRTDQCRVIDTSRLYLEWRENYWDSAILGNPVLQITRLKIKDQLAKNDFALFENERDGLQAGLVSCRLPHQCLSESIFLEENGFRLIEMLYQPELNGLQARELGQPGNVDVYPADNQDLEAILKIAGNAFRDDRFHVDPRLDSSLGDQRYINWVRDSQQHQSQKLYSFSQKGKTVGFFVTEVLDNGTWYWHLTAVSPDVQGKGIGRRVWLAMLSMLKESGVDSVRSCISARNYRVLNLYISLGFRFPPPLMTLHWVRDN